MNAVEEVWPNTEQNTKQAIFKTIKCRLRKLLNLI